MKIYEIIAFNREILDRFERIGIRPNDHKLLPLYNDYRAMKARREKMTYIVAVLAERYAVRRSTALSPASEKTARNVQ